MNKQIKAIWSMGSFHKCRSNYEIPNTFWIYDDITSILSLNAASELAIANDDFIKTDFEELLKYLNIVFKKESWIESIKFMDEISKFQNKEGNRGALQILSNQKILNILIGMGYVSYSPYF